MRYRLLAILFFAVCSQLSAADREIDISYPSWSPDGKQIVFQIGPLMSPGSVHDIYIVNADGTNLRRLPRRGKTVDQPSWSPDGKQIAFSSAKKAGPTKWDLKWDICVMDPSGSHFRELTRDGKNAAAPAWSPDGTRIAFSENGAAEDTTEIYVMNADGSNARQLTHLKHISWPTWSPDGKKIAVGMDVDTGRVWVMDADGSHAQELPVFGKFNWFPAWSPDGKTIALTCALAKGPRICVMDGDGSNAKELSLDVAAASFTAWSPDGKRIAFACQTEGVWDLCVSDADGSNLRQLKVSHK